MWDGWIEVDSARQFGSATSAFHSLLVKMMIVRRNLIWIVREISAWWNTGLAGPDCDLKVRATGKSDRKRFS